MLREGAPACFATWKLDDRACAGNAAIRLARAISGLVVPSWPTTGGWSSITALDTAEREKRGGSRRSGPVGLEQKKMSWFNASQLSTFAKQALSQAQKSIDRVLDIQGEEEEEGERGPAGAAPSRVGEAGKVAARGRWRRKGRRRRGFTPSRPYLEGAHTT